VTIVPDASVILKWVLRSADENDNDQALGLLRLFRAGHCRVVLPSLWVYEVGNILGLKEPRLAPHLLARLIACGFEEKSGSELYSRTLMLMEKYGVSFYDASYHATALVAEGMLLTSDERYYRRAKTAGSICRLGSWSSPEAGT
jgi:predicted nucleic acid-binding protein